MFFTYLFMIYRSLKASSLLSITGWLRAACKLRTNLDKGHRADPWNGQSSNDMPTNTSQCCRHLGETIERAGSFPAHSQPYKETIENRASKILPIFWLKYHLGFACSMSSVALTDNIFAVLETLECFLSKAANYMHSRASFRDKISCLKRECFFIQKLKERPLYRRS